MTKQEVIADMMATGYYADEQDAQGNLESVILELQELKLEGDLRRDDIHTQADGLGLTQRHWLFLNEQIQDCNIPEEVKERHSHEDDDDWQDESEFNPLDYAGLLGEDVAMEMMEMMY